MVLVREIQSNVAKRLGANLITQGLSLPTRTWDWFHLWGLDFKCLTVNFKAAFRAKPSGEDTKYLSVESLTRREASSATWPLHPTNPCLMVSCIHESAHTAGVSCRLSLKRIYLLAWRWNKVRNGNLFQTTVLKTAKLTCKLGDKNCAWNVAPLTWFENYKNEQTTFP